MGISDAYKLLLLTLLLIMGGLAILSICGKQVAYRCFVCRKVKPFHRIHSFFDINPYDYSIKRCMCKKCVVEGKTVDDRSPVPSLSEDDIINILSPDNMNESTYKFISSIIGLSYIERSVPREKWGKGFKRLYMEGKLKDGVF